MTSNVINIATNVTSPVGYNAKLEFIVVEAERLKMRLKRYKFRLKRRNQCWYVFAYIGWNFKSKLYFYTGSGVGGRFTQADYIVILEEFVAPNWNPNWILLEDNDQSHGT